MTTTKRNNNSQPKTNYNKQAQRVIWYKMTMTTTTTVYKSDTNNKNVQPVIEVDNRIRKKTPITKRVQRIRISSKLMMTSFAPHFYADFFSTHRQISCMHSICICFVVFDRFPINYEMAVIRAFEQSSAYTYFCL